MRINIEASAEELAEIGLNVSEIPEFIIGALDSCISLPGYNVTVNEPSAIQAQLVEAVQAMRAAWAAALCWPDSSSEMSALDMADEGLRAALTAVGEPA